MGQLKDKAVLVTGESSGIGRASGLVFAREGAKVVLSDVDIEGGMGICFVCHKNLTYDRRQKHALYCYRL